MNGKSTNVRTGIEVALEAPEAFDVFVEELRLEPYARKAGIPEKALALFSGPGARFLIARKG